jgi:hypothetical protein
MYMLTAVIIIVAALWLAGDLLDHVKSPTFGHHLICATIVIVSIGWSIKLQILAYKPLDLVAVHKYLRKERRAD